MRPDLAPLNLLFFQCLLRHFEKNSQVFFNKEPLLIQKQTIPQQKALDLSFNLRP